MQLPAVNTIRLSQLTDIIRNTVERAFLNNAYWIIADVTNHTFRQAKNYHHLELVEKHSSSTAVIARMQAKAWGDGATSIEQFESATGQRFTNNIQVLINVSVTYHPMYGLQLNINHVDPNFTMGLLEQQRQATLQKLLANHPEIIQRSGDRFITRNQGIILNKVIQRIAVVSSNTSAGWQDFHAALAGNEFGYRFHVDDFFTSVQGEANAGLFVNKLIEIFNTGNRYDAVVIIRGGGAQADFQIFDEYVMGRVIAKYPIPVITGIGHQKNETITDLMAHTQTRTPTQAAEFIVHHNRSFEEEVKDLQNKVIIKAQQLFAFHSGQLSRLRGAIVGESTAALYQRKAALFKAGSFFSVRPQLLLAASKNNIDHLYSNIVSFSNRKITTQKGNLVHYLTLMKLLSPEKLLKRGFAIVKSNNRIISDPDTLTNGDQFTLLFGKEEILATIKDKKEYDGKDFNL